MSSSIRLTSSGAPDTPPSGYARLYVEEFEGQLYLKMKRPDGSVQVFGTINTPLVIEQGGTGLTQIPQNGQLLIGNGTGYVLSALTAGTNIQITNDEGSITLDVPDVSVEIEMPSEFDVAGSPVTNTGTISVTKKPQAPNTVYAGPTVNIENVPTFRLLTQDDIPQLSKYKIIDFDDHVQDLLAITIDNTASIVLEYDNTDNKLTAFLTETGVVAGTYGSTQFIPAIEIDAQGRVLNVTEIPATFLSNQISDITEKIEDTVGNLIKETDSIQIEYNDVLSSLELNIKPEYLITTNISDSENFKAPTSQSIKIYVDEQITIEQNQRELFDSFLQDEVLNTQRTIGVGSSVTYSGHAQSTYLKSTDFQNASLLKNLNNADKLLDLAIKQVSDSLDSEIERAENAEDTLNSLVNETVDRLNILEGTEEGSVSKAVADEAALRILNDSITLSTANTYTDNKVSQLIDSAPEVLNTLKELADALGSDPNFATTISNQIGVISANLTAETNRAITAETLLQGLITAEQNLRIQSINSILNNITEIEDDLAQEVTNRINADLLEKTRAELAEIDLQNQIDDLQTDLLQEISDREAAVLTEATARQTADSSLGSRLDILEGPNTQVGSIAKAEKDAKDYADSIVLAETIRAQAAEGELASDISAVASDLAQELLDRAAADTTLQSNIDDIVSDLTQEVNDRQAGDANALALAKSYTDTEIADLVASAPAVLDTLKELADALGSDPNFATTIANNIGAVAANLATEITRATTAENDLADGISAEESRALAAENILDSRLDILQGADTVLGSVAKALKDANDYTDTRIADVLGNVTPDVIESLTALQNALFDNNSETGILNAISAEKIARETQDNNIQNEINATQLGAGLNTNGSYEPETSSTYINTASSLKSADTLLDNAINAIQTELNTTQSSVGLNSNGTYTAPATSTYLALTVSIKDALEKLDTAIKTEVDNRIADVNAEETRAILIETALQDSILQITGGSTGSISSLQTELDTTQTGAGLNSAGTYNPHSTSNYISTATSLRDADIKLDTAIKTVENSVVALENQVGEDLQLQISNVQSSIDAEIIARTNDVNTINSRLNTFFENAPLDFDTILEIDARISTLETSNASSTIQTQINALDLRLDTVESDITALEQQDDAISARIDVVESDISAEVETRISEVNKLNNKINTTTAIIQNLIGVEAQTRTDEIDRVYNSIQGFKTTVNLTPNMLNNGVVINPNQMGDIMPNTIVAFIDRVGLFEDLDFYLDNTNGKIELFFLPEILSIIDGTEVLRISYLIRS